MASFRAILICTGCRTPVFNSPIAVCTNDDLRSVNTHLSSSMGDDFFVTAVLNFVNLLLTGGTSCKINGDKIEGRDTSSNSRTGLESIPRSGLMMARMFSLSFFFSLSFSHAIRIDPFSFGLSVIKCKSPLTPVRLRLR